MAGARSSISGVIEVAARPSPVGVDLLHTAVVVIDMQNNFAAPGEMFDRAGIDLGRPRSAAVAVSGRFILRILFDP
jgi:hypothetical protein